MKTIVIIGLISMGAVFGNSAYGQSTVKPEKENHGHRGNERHHHHFRLFHFGRHHHGRHQHGGKHDHNNKQDCKQNQTPTTTNPAN